MPKGVLAQYGRGKNGLLERGTAMDVAKTGRGRNRTASEPTRERGGETDSGTSILDFQDQIDRFGEDLNAWPRDKRRSAQALLRQSEHARQIIDRARQLRALLSVSAVEAPAGLRDRIMVEAMSTSPKSEIRIPVGKE
jgi:hypothetical protein